MCGDREGEADVHAAGVTFDRCVEELVDLSESDDFIELAANLGAGHAED